MIRPIHLFTASFAIVLADVANIDSIVINSNVASIQSHHKIDGQFSNKIKTQIVDSIIVQSVELNVSQETAFQLFTNNSSLEMWLTEKADVIPVKGGKYELFWEPATPEINSTIGCKVLSVERPFYINFEWKGPKQFKHFMNTARPLTNVTVLFNATEKGSKVTLIHTGWRDSQEWQEARQYFVNAWRGAFARLEEYATTLN